MSEERDAWGNKRSNNRYYISETKGFDFSGFYPRPKEQFNSTQSKYTPSSAMQSEINKQVSQDKFSKLEREIKTTFKKAKGKKTSKSIPSLANIPNSRTKAFTQNELKEFDFHFDFSYMPNLGITHPDDFDYT